MCQSIFPDLFFKEADDEDEEELVNPEVKVPPKIVTPVKTTTTAPDTVIGIEADKSLLRDFLSGDYCIHGVS